MQQLQGSWRSGIQFDTAQDLEKQAICRLQFQISLCGRTFWTSANVLFDTSAWQREAGPPKALPAPKEKSRPSAPAAGFCSGPTAGAALHGSASMAITF